ncbi:MAG: NADH-quinone oxidoreductase subunit N [Trueperaceae bacterium]|nr:NADH-quinone oxidoreductase subunit N [Trueperaceae bacterium]
MTDVAGELRMAHDLALMVPELTLLVASALALIAEMLRRPTWSLWLAGVGLLAGTVLTVPLVGTETTVFMGTYRVDALAAWSKLILFPAAALVLVLLRSEIRGKAREGTAYSLLAFTTLGSVVLAGVGDVMLVVLGVLLASLGSFALVAFEQDDRSTEAGMKYFVFGSVASALMAFGLSYWFAAAGSTLLSDLAALETMRVAGVAGLVGVVVGLGYKAALAPFHFWAPDAYDGAPVAIAAFLSVVPKVGALFALAQVVHGLPDELGWRAALAVLAVVSMTYGNLAALTQTSVVRLLAYSSVAQSGYFLLGVIALGRSELALDSLVVFAAAYAAMNLGAFAVVMQVGRELEDFTGLGRALGWLGAAMVVFLLSLVGIPPFAGFAGKLLLFGAAIDAEFAWLAVVGILNSVLALAVYLRIVVAMYQRGARTLRPLRPVLFVSGLALLLTVAIGLGAEAFLVRPG